MDRTMNEPLEQRVKTLELKVEFLENWKNTPFIQVTLPVILSMFLVASWANFAFSSLQRNDEVLDKRMSKLESKIDKLLTDFATIKSQLRKP